MIANDQFRGRTAAGRQPRHRALEVEPRNPSTGALRVSNAYPVIPPAGRETRLRDYPPSSAWSGLRRTGMGRRVQKVVEKYESSAWSTNAVMKFVWDLSAVRTGQAGGWLLIAELDGLDSDPVSRSRGAATGAWAALVRTYTWGLDLSGTFQGAGGILLRPPAADYGGQVGGLLMVDDAVGDGFCGFYPVIPPQRRETGLRANHANLGQLIDADTGQTLAEYEFDPYGREIRAAGPLAAWNRIRFSTKYLDTLDPEDPDAALLYYGYRYLSPRLGRWMRRDPIEEQGGGNLYRFILNCPVGHIDPDGRQTLHIWGNWCGPGYCGNGRNPGCEGNPAFWATAALYPVVDRLDRCCRDHDSCLGQVEWDWGSGSWVRDPHPNSPYGCDNELCLCARSTAAGGSPHRRRARAGIICLFCFIEVHAP